MDDSGTNSTNPVYQDNFTGNMNAQNINVDIDNLTRTTDNDAAANILNRNNITARDHLFQAMFSRIALTYDRTFPPFARRFIEFMLLLTAISVLFILIYIHMAFVKAPITCLDHFSFNENMVRDSSDGSIKHMVIRVEVLSNPPSKYGLYHSYSKEYDDLNQMNQSDSVETLKLASTENFSRWLMFMNLIRKQCFKNFSQNKYHSEKYGDKETFLDVNKPDEKDHDQSSDGILHRLFSFPINPILEKAEYWREKLSVRAMAPFRQTFNELELFAKSVFTEEKYIMEYSLEYGLLRLTPQTRERLNIPVHFVLLDANKDQCFGNGLSRFLLQEFVGYDQIIIGSLKRLAERQNGKGYVRNVVSGEHYRFVNSWMSRTSYLAAGFIMIIFTLSVSMLLRYSHHQIFVFIVDLLRMLENNLQFSFPAAPLLTVVLALVGMEAIMSEFFNDTSTAFYTILIIWLADQYEAVCCRTYVSKRHWPKYFYLYHFAFYAYHYRFNGQFSGLALLCSWLFIQHSMFFFFHHYELPRLMHGIAVRAIMDSLIVERAENTSQTPSSMFPNDDDDIDRSDGDRYDHDDDPGTSTNIPSMAASGEVMEDKNDNINCQGEHEQEKYHETPSNYSNHQHHTQQQQQQQHLSLFSHRKLFVKNSNFHSKLSCCSLKSYSNLFLPGKTQFNSDSYRPMLDKFSSQKIGFSSYRHFPNEITTSKLICFHSRNRFICSLSSRNINTVQYPEWKHLSNPDVELEFCKESYSATDRIELKPIPSPIVICWLAQEIFTVIVCTLTLMIPPNTTVHVKSDNRFVDSRLCQFSTCNLDLRGILNYNQVKNNLFYVICCISLQITLLPINILSNSDNCLIDRESLNCCFSSAVSSEIRSFSKENNVLCKCSHHVSSSNPHQILSRNCNLSANLIIPGTERLISPEGSLDNLLSPLFVKIPEFPSCDLYLDTKQGSRFDLGLKRLVV